MTADTGIAAAERLEYRSLPAVAPLPTATRLVRRRGPWVLAALVLAATVWAIAGTGAGSRALVNPGGWPLLLDFIKAAVRPQLSSDFLALTWDATLTTLAFAVLGTLLSLVIGAVGGVLASETWWRSGGATASRGRSARRLGAWVGVRATLGLPRGVHEVVWGLFLASFLGINPLVGVLAIGIPYGAVTAKVFSEVIDEARPEAFLALRAAGAGRLTALLYGLLPGASTDLISYGFYRFECSIRGAAILGIIGAGGLGFQLSLSFVSLQYNEIWTLLLALLALSAAAEVWGSRVRHHLRAPRRLTRLSADGGSRARRDPVLIASLAVGILLVPVMAWHLGIDPSTLWAARARTLLGTVVSSAVPPDLAPAHLLDLLRLSLETLRMSVLAIVIASSSGILVAFGAARGHGAQRRRLVPLACRALLLFCRAVPPPVWALLLLFVLFPGSLPGALALGVYNFGILGRLMAESVDNLEPDASRALRVQGASAA
ncbi:MAG: ABC transporter permease subunit, partial [Candidatus Dormibacteraeota bacterium]|nr:ABC transporter permease subunit [Candidatus Dormibacteraeota bacterium]